MFRDNGFRAEGWFDLHTVIFGALGCYRVSYIPTGVIGGLSIENRIWGGGAKMCDKP